MGRIIGLDYGTKRVGIAETDDLKIIASPLVTVHSKDVIQFIKDYILKHDVESVVIGHPKNLDATDTDATKLVNDFVKNLKKKIPALNIIMEDERFTSKMASKAMIAGGVKKSKRRVKGNLDKVSAALILQSYLTRQSNGF